MTSLSPDKQAVVELLMQKAAEHTSALRLFHGGRYDIERHIATFRDDTIAMLHEALQDASIKAHVLQRTFLLLGTNQKKNLEPTVRNIVIFTSINESYRGALNIESSPWSVFHPAERYARKYVCGVHNAIETPDQIPAMRAIVQAIYALTIRYKKEQPSRDVNYAIADVMRNLTYNGNGGFFTRRPIHKNPKSKALIEMFVTQPEDADHLASLVIERGECEPETLSIMLETEASLTSGVL